MSFFDLLKMVGGLALFLYGMNLLGDGLSRASGGRLERILEKLTNNPLKAVLMGAVVTGVIQSSSATTVMVVGFVNSGIMSLKQAVGIIMGANIGTTVTSWILSLTGIESDAFWIRMLKPSSFSPILAIVGVGILLFSHKDKLKNAATILVGFAILMFGMDSMSAAVSPLAEVPEFTNLLIKFQNPVFGVLAGLILTAGMLASDNPSNDAEPLKTSPAELLLIEACLYEACNPSNELLFTFLMLLQMLASDEHRTIVHGLHRYNFT